MNQVLNKAVKEIIVDNALAKAGIPQRKKALRAARVDWAERVRLKAIGGPEAEAEILKAEKKIAALIAKLPEELRTDNMIIRTRADIYLNLAGSRVRVLAHTLTAITGAMNPVLLNISAKLHPMNIPCWQTTHSLPSSTDLTRFTGKLKAMRPTSARTSPPHWIKPEQLRDCLSSGRKPKSCYPLKMRLCPFPRPFAGKHSTR